MRQTAIGDALRKDFPIFRDSGLIYLDSAASAQKPEAVLQAMTEFCENSYANVHRGVYRLSERATMLFEEVREKVRSFIGATSTDEVIFTRGTTESINLVAYSWGLTNLSPGDEIVTTIFEHHSNFVPWQVLAEKTGATIRYVRLGEDGGFSWVEFSNALSSKTKLVAFTHLANGLGLLLPVKEMVAAAKKIGAVVLVDAAQAIPHYPVDVQDLDVDFLAFSGHKMYGPTGVGVLYGRKTLLQEMPPFLSGGDMILSVSVSGTTFNKLPFKFEAGTPNIIGVIGLGAAIDYLNEIGLAKIGTHESELIGFLESELSQIPGVQILGPTGQHHGLVCFTTGNVHPHDLAQFLDKEGICVRAGHHCAQPILDHFGLSASTRASIGLYNGLSDIEKLCQSVKKALRYFSQ